MAVLLSRATGNWTDATTWALVNAASYFNSEVGGAALTTTYVTSATFTPGAITIDAIAIKVSVRGSVGTISVALDQAGATVTNTEVTINIADLPDAATATADGGWVVFKFSTSVTLTAATLYSVKAKITGGTTTLFRDAVAGNISRMLRTTTTQAPAAGDVLVVAGEHTGAGTGNDITVTMNSTATTDYGNAPTAANGLIEPGVSVSKRGTLSYGITAATNYYLKVSSSVIVYRNGTLNIGTTGTPMPRDSTAVLELDPAADGDYGLLCRNGGTLNIQGQSRTSGKNIVWCLLNTDEAANSTSLGVDTDTGWLDNDQIAVASTTHTAAECEVGTLNGNAGASSLTVDGFAGAVGGLLNAHSGTSPMQAEVINITRNVKIRSATSTIVAYVYCGAEAIVDIDWAEFYYLGENVANKRGIEIQTAALGNFNMQFSSIHDVEDGGFYATSSALTNVVFSNNVQWNCASITATNFNIALATTGTWTVDSNVVMKPGAGGCFTLIDVGGTFTNNRAVGGFSHGFNLNEASGTIGTFSGNTAHSCTTNGLNFNGITLGGTVSNLTSWRNNPGMNLSNDVKDVVIDGATLFGNGSWNITFGAGSQSVRFKSLTFAADATFPSFGGITWFAAGATHDIIMDDCNFAPAAHGTGDILPTDSSLHMLLRNTNFGPNELPAAYQAAMGQYAYVASQKHDQTAGNHKTWMKNGTVQTDATIFNTAAPSMRMTPLSASAKLESAYRHNGIKVPVASGSTVTINVYTRKSVVGDGAAYNGSEPRLILRANPAIGIAADVVLDTHSVAAGTWEQLSGTTPAASGDDGVMEFVVDCDGTAGWVNVDDFSVS